MRAFSSRKNIILNFYAVVRSENYFRSTSLFMQISPKTCDNNLPMTDQPQTMLHQSANERSENYFRKVVAARALSTAAVSMVPTLQVQLFTV